MAKNKGKTTEKSQKLTAKRVLRKIKKSIKRQQNGLSAFVESTTSERIHQLEQWVQHKWQQTQKRIWLYTSMVLFICLALTTIWLIGANQKLKDYQKAHSEIFEQHLQAFQLRLDSIASNYKAQLYNSVAAEIQSDSFNIYLEEMLSDQFNTYASSVLLPETHRIVDKKLIEIETNLKTQFDTLYTNKNGE